ncbi:MAG: HD domain-containing protein [Acidobacteriota bacterium]|nr:MAG: HD domain-containing protein [Acidobacteriota bacterium]
MPSTDRKISLRYLVLLTLLLVGLVPLVLTGWMLSDRSGSELRAAENRYQIQLVQEKARRIEIFAERARSTVYNLKTAIELGDDPFLSESDQLADTLSSMLRENPEIAGIHISSDREIPISVFRPEILDGVTLNTLANDAASAKTELTVGRPHTIESSGHPVLTFAVETSGAGRPAIRIVTAISAKRLAGDIVGFTSISEQQLWESGLPIVFVVDDKGEAVFHPDNSAASSGRRFTDLKIVSEWLESGRIVQSALVPFDAVYNDKPHRMIGAYSTASISEGRIVGVVAMQDESKALASVADIRRQVWLISLGFAIAAMFVGLLLARSMTNPLLRLTDAAKRIAAGDYSSRVASRNVTEIGTLADSFDQMSGKIEEQIARLAKAAEENRELFVGTVKALAAAIDGKDKYTRGHSERVARISVAIGRRMNLPEDELETLRISALLHDVGKIAIDDNILKKPAALTDEEFEIMKQHPVRGYKIMSQIPAMKDFLPGMYMHHEMVNGKGYPQGLTGDQIPLQAKIVSVADTFDAMTIDRPYQKGMELGAALERLRSFVGTRYQSEVVEALIEACNAGEVGQGIIRQLAEKRAAEAATSEHDPLLDRLVA